MKITWSNHKVPAALLAICSAVFLISAGLCGVQWAIAMGPRSDSLGDWSIPLGIAEIVAMVGSGAVAVIIVFLMILRAFFGGASGGDSDGLFPGKDPQTLFHRDDSKDEDKKT
jgi:hypothetical protein